MADAKHDPKRSEGARTERAAMRSKLRRLLKELDGPDAPSAEESMGNLLQWVLDRQKRYDAKPGGL